MRAIVIPEIGSFGVQDVPDPVAVPGWLTLTVGAAGICGTDFHIISGEFPPARYPCIPGHEFAGTVAEVGEGVGDFRPGDRVAVMPMVTCETCHACRSGRSNLCAAGGGFGVSYPGGFAERVAIPVKAAYRIPDSLSFKEAAMLEPFACVVHAFHRLSPTAGESYLIYGAGTMGLMLAQYARFAGAKAVGLVDRKVARLERARGFGFDILGLTFEDVRDASPMGFDNVIEATGVPRLAELAFDAVVPGGKLLLFGVCPPGEKVEYEPFRIYSREIDVIGSMAMNHSYQPALEAMLAGAIDAKRMASHAFDLEDFGTALDVMRSGEATKVQIIAGTTAP